MHYMIAVSLEMSDEPILFVPLQRLVTIFACFLIATLR